MEEDDLTPYPRAPPPKSFNQLQESDIALSADKYASCSRESPRYDSYDYAEEKNAPRWSDEDRFFEWLISAKIPRQLAEMLYLHAPEVSFMLGPGHINGVEAIIDYNSEDSEIRKGGFFALASGPNGDFIVVDLDGDATGEVGYLSHEEVWGMNPEDVRKMFIPVARSIGLFFEAFEAEGECDLPSDYYDAKEKYGG